MLIEFKLLLIYSDASDSIITPIGLKSIWKQEFGMKNERKMATT